VPEATRGAPASRARLDGASLEDSVMTSLSRTASSRSTSSAVVRRDPPSKANLIGAAGVRRNRRASRRIAFSIRRGGLSDVPTILRLIRGLAEYERLAHQVEATIGRIRRHGFGRRPYFETLICRRDGRAVGFALYFFTYSTFLGRPSLYLEDLFVLPEERGTGAGKALLGALARIAVRRGCGRMEWTVLDWNRRAIGFYRRLGANLRKEWILTRLTGEPLRRLAR
jgi:GNAT superfamily N-acetyltransferase